MAEAWACASGAPSTIIAGPGGLTKTGNGTLQLTAASASTYTGDTIVGQGRLLTTPAQVAGAVIVLGSATLGVDLTTAGTTLLSTSLDTATGSTIQLGTGALGNPFAPVIATGALTINGPTTLRVSGSALTTATGRSSRQSA